MKAVVLEETGGPEALVCGRCPSPRPSTGSRS